jgi:hypothetical protein
MLSRVDGMTKHGRGLSSNYLKLGAFFFVSQTALAAEISGSSVASSPRSRGPWVDLQVSGSFGSKIVDPRSVPTPGFEFGIPENTVEAPLISLSETLFTTRLALNRSLVGPEAINFVAQFPLRHLSADTVAGKTSNYEFGGLGLGFESALGTAVKAQVGVQIEQSPKFALFQSNYRFDVGLSIFNSEPINNTFEIGVRARPGLTMRVPNGDNPEQVKYGRVVGGEAALFLDFKDGKGPFIRGSLGASFFRVSDYTRGALREGGAGLLSFVPSIDFFLIAGVSLSFQATLPIFRPEKREYAFATPSMPGLYGKGLGIGLRASSF